MATNTEKMIESHKFYTSMAGSKNYWDYMVKVIENVGPLVGGGTMCRDTDYREEILKTFSFILEQTKWPENPNEWIAIHLKLSQGAMMQLRFLFDYMQIRTKTEEWWDSNYSEPVVEVKGPIEHNWNGNVPTVLELLKLNVVSLPQVYAQEGWDRGFAEHKLDKTIKYTLEYNSLNLKLRQFYLMSLYFDKYRWDSEIINNMKTLLENNIK